MARIRSSLIDRFEGTTIMKTMPALLALCCSMTLAQKPAVEAPAFLAGCWEQRGADGGLLIQEQWMPPLGGQMLGMGRTSRQGRVVDYEHTLIEKTAATGLDFVATPSGQTQTRFALVKHSATMVEFNNPAHDFPTTVRYTLQAADELLAQIEGPSKGPGKGTKVIDFRYRRVACP